MSDILDLDALAPEPKQVRIDGKIFDLFPIKVKVLIKIQKIFLEWKSGKITDDNQDIEAIIETLKPVFPGISEVDLTFQQLLRLLEFASEKAIPEQKQVQTEEKKGGQITPSSLPTS